MPNFKPRLPPVHNHYAPPRIGCSRPLRYSHCAGNLVGIFRELIPTTKTTTTTTTRVAFGTRLLGP